MSLYSALYGSSIFPAMIDVNGVQIQLGELVRAAHKESGLSVKDWNLLDEETRDAKLTRMLSKLRETNVTYKLGI